VEKRVNVYLIVTMLRMLVVLALVLLAVAAAALAERLQQRRLEKRSEALAPLLAASGAGSESARLCECHAADTAGVTSSPVVIDHRAQRRAA
jgi:Tfp pilus assembly protein FimT